MLTRTGIAILLAATIAANASAQNAVAGAGAPTWGSSTRLVQELKIGQLEGAEQYTFGSVDGIAVGLDGAMFVYDGKVPIIRMYDATGKFVRNVGRAGEGPGEYRDVLGIETMADGRIAIWDPRNNRITLFDGKGEY
ncbi:MAG: 6-bladed beta-propeller, partial [Gemmatimonadota bacterium]